MFNFLQAAGGSAPMMINFMMIGGMIAIFYFLIIRPQQRRQKEQKRMLDALAKGDKVITSGGIRGTIVGVKDDYIVLRIDENVKIEVNRANVSTVLK